LFQRLREKEKAVNYEVRVVKIENTGLDCEVFATRKEAEQAAKIVRSVFGCKEEECVVVTTSQPVTTTFIAWNEKGY
jgi:hypothetical protein